MMDNQPNPCTIGILYPGEMGSSLGKLLSEAGSSIVTTVDGRSPRTHRICREAGLNVVDSRSEVLDRSDIVISLVSPASALSVAKDVAAAHRDSSSRNLLYIDANSISPMTVAQISELLDRAAIDFIDASIFGLASQLRQRGTLYLSGPRANEVSGQFESIPRVKVVGDTPGQASALKMIVAGIPKGLSALFIETMLFAQDMQLLNEAVEACDELYPSIMEIVRRMLPTYPQHAARRCEELQEVEETMLLSGLTPRIVHAVREVTSALADSEWPKHDRQQWTIAELIQEIQKQGALQSSKAHQSPGRMDENESGSEEQPISAGDRSDPPAQVA
jgi:3-hydroxyisobutyrate dehydrogenase-like beta-hydroxyacid dehydrogenase